MKSVNFLTLILMLSLFVWSCNENDEIAPEDIGNNKYSMFQIAEQVDKEMTDFARESLARELSTLISKNPEVVGMFESLIKETRATGYYENEFFWNASSISSTATERAENLKDLLIELDPENAELLSFICQQMMAMTILQVNAVQTGTSNGNENSPRIYVDDGIDDNNPEAKIAYYENGVKFEQPISQKPSAMAFIVRESEVYVPKVDFLEEYVVNTQNELMTIPTDCDGEIWIWEPGNGGGTPPGGGSTTTCEEPCERDCEEGTENIRRFRARHDYEGWTKGTGEFVFYSIFADEVTYELVDGNVVVMGDALDYVIHRATGVEGNNEWMYPDFEIFIWDRLGDGDRVKHVLYEDDGGGNNSISIPLSLSVTVPLGVPGATATGSVGATIDISLSNNDDLIGESIVEYCQNIDPQGFEYHPSNTVDFIMNERTQ